MTKIKQFVSSLIQPDPRIRKLLAELEFQKKAIDKFHAEFDGYDNYFCTYKNSECMSKGILIWAKDKNLKIISANKPAEKFGLGLAPEFQLTKEKEYKGQTTKDLFNHRENGNISAGELGLISDDYVREAKKPARFFTFNSLRGRKFLLDTHKTPLFNAEMEFIGIKATGTDEIHRRKDIVDLLRFYLESGMADRLDQGETLESALFVINDRRQSQYKV